MPRPKKDQFALNMRVEASVMRRFNAYCQEAGQTRTCAFERIVTDFLDRYDDEKRRYEAYKAEGNNGN